MPSTMKKISPSVVEFEIQLSAEEVDKSVNQAYAHLARDAKVKGFRKGKVPRTILKRMFGPALLNELRSEVVSNGFLDALKQHGVDPISEPTIEAGDLAEGQPYFYKVKVETAPQLESLCFEGIEITRRPIAVSDSEIDTEIERLRASMATVQDLEEQREAREGDQVTIAMKRWEEGEWKESGLPPQEISLVKGEIPAELMDAVVGMNVDDEKVVEFDHTTTGGEHRRFLCTLIALKARKLPDVDDEFARDVGEFESLQHLRTDIERHIREAKEKREIARQQRDLFDGLRLKNEMDLPTSIVEQQSKAMKAQLSNLFGPKEGEKDDTVEKLTDSSDKAARDIVHQHFLLKEIARQFNLEVTESDLDDELSVMAEKTGLPVPKLRAELYQSQRFGELKLTILERKVFDFVLPKVKITEVSSSEDDKPND